MAFETLVSDVLRDIHGVPKEDRLDFLKAKISGLSADERAAAEHILSLALISVDHAPEKQKTPFQRVRSFFRWPDLISIPLAVSGLILIFTSDKPGEVEFSFTDMSVKTEGGGYFLFLVGFIVFLSRGVLSRAKP